MVTTHLILKALWYIGVTLAVCIVLLKKKYRIGLIALFMVFYSAGQILGYGFDVHLLKAVVPVAGPSGTAAEFQVISSTMLPLVISLTIYIWYKRVVEAE